MSVPAAYIGVILIWSTTPLAIKWSSDGPGFILGVTGRMVLGAILCVLLLRWLNISLPLDRKAKKTYVIGGITLYVAMLSVYWSAQFIPSGLISVLFGLSPLLTGVMAWVWLNERGLTPMRLGGLILGISGLLMVFHSGIQLGPEGLYGVAGVLLSVLIHSAGAVWIKDAARDIPAAAMTTGSLFVAAPLYGLTWIATGAEIPDAIPLRAGLAIVYLGFFGSVLGFVLYFYMLKRLPVSSVAAITLITPVSALLLGHWLGGERVDPWVWAGTAFILAGLLLHESRGWPFPLRRLEKQARARDG